MITVLENLFWGFIAVLSLLTVAVVAWVAYCVKAWLH